MGLASSSTAHASGVTPIEISNIDVGGDKTKSATSLLAAFLDSEHETLISVTSNNIEYFSTKTGEVRRGDNTTQETAVGGQVRRRDERQPKTRNNATPNN